MDPTAKADDSLDHRVLTEEILHNWDGWRAKQGDFHIKDRDIDPNARKRFTVVYSMACQAHEAAKGYLAAFDKAPLTATPMARSCFELGLTAHWAAQVPDAWAAITNKDLYDSKKLANELQKAREPVYRKAGDKLAASIAEKGYDKLNTTSEGPSKSFQQLCDDLEGSQDAYWMYRLQSRESHAGLHSSNHWFIPTEDGEDLRIQLSPPAPEISGWLYLLAASLVVAEAAVDHLDESHDRQTYLDELAARVECAKELRPSEKAVSRLQEGDA